MMPCVLHGIVFGDEKEGEREAGGTCPIANEVEGIGLALQDVLRVAVVQLPRGEKRRDQ